MALEGKELVRQRERDLAQTDALIAATEEEMRLALAAIAKAEAEKQRSVDDPEVWAQADAKKARQERELERLQAVLEKRRGDRVGLVPKLSQARAEEAKAELDRGCSARANRTRVAMPRLRELEGAAATILSLRQADKARHSRAWELGRALEIEVEWPENADEPDFAAVAPNLLKLLTEGPWTPRADEEAARARSAEERRRHDEEMLRSIERQFPSALLQLPERLREEGGRRQEARRSVRS